MKTEARFKVGQIACYEENDGLGPEYHLIRGREFRDDGTWYYQIDEDVWFKETDLRRLTDTEKDEERRTLGERMGTGAPAVLLQKIENILGRCVFDQPDSLDYDEGVELVRKLPELHMPPRYFTCGLCGNGPIVEKDILCEVCAPRKGYKAIRLEDGGAMGSHTTVPVTSQPTEHPTVDEWKVIMNKMIAERWLMEHENVSFPLEQLAKLLTEQRKAAQEAALQLAAQTVTDLCHQNESERDGILIEAAMAIRALHPSLNREPLVNAPQYYNDPNNPDSELVIDPEPPHKSVTVGELRARSASTLREALQEANEVCRSAHSIAARSGKETNWDAFKLRLEKSLKIQKQALEEKK